MSHTEVWSADCQQCGFVFACDGVSELCPECRDKALSRIEADLCTAQGLPHPVFHTRSSPPRRPGVVVKRICAKCHHAFDPHTYPSATCYPCDEKLANRGQAAKAEAHRPPGRAGGSPKKERKVQPVERNPYLAQWGHSSPEMEALHAMDKRVDKLQGGLTKTIQELKTDRLALTARAEQAEQHPEIVAANTMAAEMEASRLFAAEQVEHERQVRRRELEEAASLVAYLGSIVSITIGLMLWAGLAAAFTTCGVLVFFAFLHWRDHRQAADRREDAMATLARNRAR